MVSESINAPLRLEGHLHNDEKVKIDHCTSVALRCLFCRAASACHVRSLIRSQASRIRTLKALREAYSVFFSRHLASFVSLEICGV